MPSVSYTTMQPTGDAVTYLSDSSTTVHYPDAGVASTFGTLLAPKLYGSSLSALEIASSGKVALTLSDAHVLDFIHVAGSNGVLLNARSNALVFKTDVSVASMSLTAAGAFVTAAGAGAFVSTNSTLAAFSNHASIMSACNAALGASNDLLLASGNTWRAEAASNMSLLSYGPVTVDSHRYQEFKIQGHIGARLAADPDGKLRLTAETLTSRDGFVTLSAYRPDAFAYRDVSDTGVVVENRTADDSNDAAGILVDSIHNKLTDNSEFFNKSLVWRHSEKGVRTLGAAAAACLTESYWDFDGGAVRFSYTNPSTGAKLGYHWRVNERDELELVKVSTNHDGTPVRYNVAAKFGQEKLTNGAYVPGFTRDRGRIVYNLAGVDSAHAVDTRPSAVAWTVSGPRSKPEIVSGAPPNTAPGSAYLGTDDASKTITKNARIDLTTESFMAFESYDFYSAAFRRYKGWRPSTADVALVAGLSGVSSATFRTAAKLGAGVNNVLQYTLSNEVVPSVVGGSLTAAGGSNAVATRGVVENVVYCVSTIVLENTAELDPVTGLTYRSIKPQVVEVLTPETTPPEIDYFEYARASQPDALHSTMPNSVTAIGASVPLDFMVSDNFRVARLYFYQRDEAIIGTGPAADDDYFWNAARAVFTSAAGKRVARAYTDAAGKLHYVLSWRDARCLYQSVYGTTGLDGLPVNPAISTPARLLDVFRDGASGSPYTFVAYESGAIDTAGPTLFPPAGYTPYSTDAALRVALGSTAGSTSALSTYRASVTALIRASTQYAWMPSGEDVKARAAASNCYALGGFTAGTGAEAALSKTAVTHSNVNYHGAVWRFGSDVNDFRITELRPSVEATLAPAVASAPEYVRDPVSGRALFFPAAPGYPTLPAGYALDAARSGHGNTGATELPAWDPLGCTFSNSIQLSAVGAHSTAYNYLAAEDAWGNVTTLAAEVVVLRPIVNVDENTVLVNLATRKTSLQDANGYALYTDLLSAGSAQTDNLIKIISALSAYKIVSIDMVVIPSDAQKTQAHATSSPNLSKASFAAAGNYPANASYSADYHWVDAARIALTAGVLPVAAPLRSNTAVSASVLTRLTESQIGALNESVAAATFVSNPVAGAGGAAFTFAQNTTGVLV